MKREPEPAPPMKSAEPLELQRVRWSWFSVM